MSWSPIVGLPIQYSEDSSGTAASGHYLKLYASGTTTPITMATDSTGATTLDKCQLNSLGQAINGSSAVFIPHVNQKYKAVLYPDDLTADEDTFASAIWNVDGITPSGVDALVSVRASGEFVKEFATMSAAIASTTLVEGDVLLIKDRDNSHWVVVLSSGVTENGYDIVQGVGVGTLSYQLIRNKDTSILALGAVAGASDSLGAIQRMITLVEADGGGIVWCPGSFSVSNYLTISANNLKIKGRGDGDQIKYTGSSRIEYLVYVAATATEGWAIEDIRLVGGEYQLGKVKWVLYAEEFHRECLLRNVVIREGLGLLNLQSCYYGKIENVQCVQSVPNPSTQGWSLADWQDVYAAGTAPIYFGGNGGATQIDRFTMSKVGSETHTANTGVNIVLFNTASCQVNSMSYENCGIAYDTYTPSTVNGIQAYSSRVTFDDFYTELTGATTRLFYAAGRSQMTFNKAFIYRFTGGSGSRLFDNDSTHRIVVNDAEIYRIDADVFARLSGSFGGGGDAFEFNNCVVATGERYTDATVNAYAENTYDTRGSRNKLGMPDTSVFPTNPRDSLFPQKNIGLVVTNGTDANGEFIQVTAGVLMNDRGNLVNCRIPTQDSITNMVVYKLRPTTVSYYFRVWVGIGGNLYLTEQAGAFSDDRGNWLAQFQTDGAGAITSLADNPRLSLRGTYNNGKARFNGTAAPVSGLWAVGDTMYLDSPTAGGYIGHVCTTGGTPGTWKTFGAVTP